MAPATIRLPSTGHRIRPPTQYPVRPARGGVTPIITAARLLRPARRAPAAIPRIPAAAAASPIIRRTVGDIEPLGLEASARFTTEARAVQRRPAPVALIRSGSTAPERWCGISS